MTDVFCTNCVYDEKPMKMVEKREKPTNAAGESLFDRFVSLLSGRCASLDECPQCHFEVIVDTFDDVDWD